MLVRHLDCLDSFLNIHCLLYTLRLSISMVVVAGPTTITPVGTICADQEGDTCNCAGAVYFGRKFASGQPGSGPTTSLAQLMSSSNRVKQVSGSIECNEAGMGGADGDPDYGYYKYCYCVPSTAGGLLFSIGLSVYLSVCLFGWITFSSLLFPLIYL